VPVEAPKVAEAPKAVTEAPKAAVEAPKAAVEAPKAAVEAPKPAVKTALSSMSLDEFEAAVKKLKIMHDQGLLTEEEFIAEKRKVLTNLY
jgi:hypothetical protein